MGTFALTAFDSPSMFISPDLITAEMGISSRHAVLTQTSQRQSSRRSRLSHTKLTVGRREITVARVETRLGSARVRTLPAVFNVRLGYESVYCRRRRVPVYSLRFRRYRGRVGRRVSQPCRPSSRGGTGLAIYVDQYYGGTREALNTDVENLEHLEGPCQRIAGDGERVPSWGDCISSVRQCRLDRDAISARQLQTGTSLDGACQLTRAAMCPCFDASCVVNLLAPGGTARPLTYGTGVREAWIHDMSTDYGALWIATTLFEDFPFGLGTRCYVEDMVTGERLAFVEPAIRASSTMRAWRNWQQPGGL